MTPWSALLEVAEHNARLMTGAGVRWARDVGAPRVIDPLDGRLRALSLGVRDRWQGRPGFPRVRAAGTWLMRAGTMPGERTVEAEDADELVALAMGQLDEGADLLKLYLDGPERGVAPWSADEVGRVVSAAHARNAKVTAHSGDLAGARVGVHGGVDAIEHGDEIDADLAAEMARRGTTLVSTLTVFRSWQTFGATTTIERFTAPEHRQRLAARIERAEESVRLAHAAGVAIATGTDFGGGSTRRESDRLGGRIAGEGRPGAVGGARCCHVARRRAPRRGGRGRHPRRRPVRLRPRPWRSTLRPRRPLEGLAGRLGLTGRRAGHGAARRRCRLLATRGLRPVAAVSG